METEKIVVIGSASVDFTTYAPRLPKPGETLIGTKVNISYGGKGANQCVAAAKLGANTSMICRMGDDSWGKEYKQYLKELQIDVSNVFITANNTTGIAQISVAQNGQNQIVFVPGANNCLSLEDVKASEKMIETANLVIGQLETPYETTLHAFKITKGITLLNAAPAIKNLEEILSYSAILCVNESEASLITDIDVHDITSANQAVRKLLNYGCNIVMITLGENGVVYTSIGQKEPVHVLCDKVVPVDATGAGDAFVGAFATFLLKYKEQPLHQVIGAACQVATMSVCKEGTQKSYPTQFEGMNGQYKYVKL